MAIELPKEAREQAIASVQRYFEEHMDGRIGNIAASGLLGFLLEEIGPSIYNKAVADVQERLMQRVQEADIDVHEDEFTYWRKYEQATKGRGPQSVPVGRDSYEVIISAAREAALVPLAQAPSTP